ncbi:efflux RND transporter periplasmic adaptor subunit [Sphingosinithalassobacter sp. CS137]|uniref:efflux RND transporter periplasmic adaptor subunit n=1 Tax=Sphingosinithalassobacter sp. CS137 TaxID=2762748 RepID=UPI0021D370C7|nr:efflux RND transporter periplasmic adaptor subunit [Sphingosinithalassobacter sp. CS137]
MMVADRIIGPLRSMDRQKRTMIGAGLALAIATAGAGYWAGSSGLFTENGSSAGAQGETIDGVVQDGSGQRVLYWYDPMIPMERYDAPGKSSMNMALIPKYADGATDGGVRVSPAMAQSLGVRIGEAQVRDLAPTVRGVGRVQIDERMIEEVQTFAPGFVESLTVRAEGEPVQAGSRIASVYSPELLTAQHEYKSLLGMSRDVAPASLRQAARDRLRLLGLSGGAIQRLESGGAPQRTYAVFAPASGIVTEIGARPGARVEPGQSIVTIAGLSRVWVVAEIPEAALAAVKVGQPVDVSFAAYPREVREGSVDYIYPSLNPETRTARVRVTLANPGLRLKEGMFANVIVQGTGGMTLTVPSEAVIATGERTVVVTRRDGAFVPVEVQTGTVANGFTEILSGLEPGDEVVLSGQFLIDSEASLSGVINRLEAATPAGEESTAQLARGTGTIQSLDAPRRRITIAHGPIPTMNWPAMTMTFGVREAAMLRGFKRGDRVDFAFPKTQQGGAYVIGQLSRDAGQ